MVTVKRDRGRTLRTGGWHTGAVARVLHQHSRSTPGPETGTLTSEHSIPYNDGKGGMDMTNEELLDQVVKMLEQQTERIELKIELDVSKKIEALFDGYKLTHEKQWELEKKLAELERRIETLEIKAG